MQCYSTVYSYVVLSVAHVDLGRERVTALKMRIVPLYLNLLLNVQKHTFLSNSSLVF